MKLGRLLSVHHSMSLQTGQILDGKYRIIRELGSGAMGAVYEGENVRIHRRVAIKVLLPAVAENKSAVQRFEREAQAAGRIGSEHIVEVLDLGTMADGGFYLVMEFLEGQTLGERIRSRGRLNPREIVPAVQQLLTGLEMAHEARIIHRDLKPDNVFLMRDYSGQRDFVKILDFGVSKFNPLNVEEGMSMTRTGAVVGTPFYMAPEQAKGAKDIDARSDIYSVGVILYEAVTGQKPFHAGTFNELIFKIVLEAPPPPETYVPNLDPAFSRIIRRAMAREADDRFSSAAEFRDTLSLWLHTGRDSREGAPTPPPMNALDWDDDKPTQTAQHGAAGTVVLGDDDNASTRMLDDAQARTQLVDPIEPKTQIADSRPSARRPPPPSRRQRTEPLEQVPSFTPPPAQLQAALAPPPTSMPAAAPPPANQPRLAPHYGQLDNALPANAPTPVPPRYEDDPWPIAGVPPSRNKPGVFAVIAGVVLAVAVGATAGIVLLRPTESTETSVEETTAASEASPAESDSASDDAKQAQEEPEAAASASAAASAGGDAETVAVAATDELTARPVPKPAPKPAPATPRPAPRATPRPPPPAAPPPAPQPAPASGTTGGSKPIRTGGRKINTEL